MNRNDFTSTIEVILPTSLDTQKFARKISPILKQGDTILLYGPIGSGKSTFARALIQDRLGRQEDVPSPTFTLVQTYPDSAGDIWHCDLYRLTHSDELFEIGLDEAFENAICLIEWPDRLGDEKPDNALEMTFHADDSGHRIMMIFGRDWTKRLGEFID